MFHPLIEIKKDGATYYYLDIAQTILHRMDGPAVIRADGQEEGWLMGDLYRIDTAQEIQNRKTPKHWLSEGIQHRTQYQEPYTHVGGRWEEVTRTIWYFNGLEHRVTGGPAKELEGIEKVWAVNGKNHREDGPSWIRNDGHKEWNINGEHHRVDGPAIDGPYSKQWWIQGKKHCEDGPAIIWKSGAEEWWQNGVRHRLDGPAEIEADGTKEWWQNGELHRLDGPAKIWKTRNHLLAATLSAWYLFGKRVPKRVAIKFSKHIGKEDIHNIPHDILKEIYQVFSQENKNTQKTK